MDDILADLPGYALRRASAVMQADCTSLLHRLHLRPTEASMLLLIGTNSGITQRAPRPSCLRIEGVVAELADYFWRAENAKLTATASAI